MQIAGFSGRKGLYLLPKNKVDCPISGRHSNVTLEALSCDSNVHGVMQTHVVTHYTDT